MGSLLPRRALGEQSSHQVKGKVAMGKIQWHMLRNDGISGDRPARIYQIRIWNFQGSPADIPEYTPSLTLSPSLSPHCIITFIIALTHQFNPCTRLEGFSRSTSILLHESAYDQYCHRASLDHRRRRIVSCGVLWDATAGAQDNYIGWLELLHECQDRGVGMTGRRPRIRGADSH